jgi:hypothetical protein
MAERIKQSHDLGDGVSVSFGPDLTATFLQDGEKAIILSRGQQESLLVAQSYYPQKQMVDRVIHADPTQR